MGKVHRKRVTLTTRSRKAKRVAKAARKAKRAAARKSGKGAKKLTRS